MLIQKVNLNNSYIKKNNPCNQKINFKGQLETDCFEYSNSTKQQKIQNTSTTKNPFKINLQFFGEKSTISNEIVQARIAKLAKKNISEKYIKDIATLNKSQFKNALKLLDKNLPHYTIKDIATLEQSKFENALKLLDAGLYFSEVKSIATLDKNQFKKAYNLINKGMWPNSAKKIACLDDDTTYKNSIGLMYRDMKIQNVISILELGNEQSTKALNLSKIGARNEDINTFIHTNIDKFDIDALTFIEKSDIYFVLGNILNLKKIKKVLPDNEIKQLAQIHEKLSDELNSVITPTEVSKENIIHGITGFFANNNSKLDEVFANANFTKYGKKGIPLEYSRNEFLTDLSNTLKNLPEEKQTQILNKMRIEAIKDDNGNITGYNGIISLSKLSNEGIEADVLNLASKFIKNNSIKTGDKEQDKALNCLIEAMPEFINVIGKQQHSTQNLSLDAHILTVYKEAVNSEEFKTLSSTGKTCLKWAIILHDIAKSEEITDKNHPYVSSLYAKNILGKYNISNNMQNRICELIKNHHWLEEYANAITDTDKIAFYFRRDEDFTIAKIMTEADLKGVSKEFYETHSSVLNELTEVPNSIEKINSTGQLLYTSKIIKNDLIPRTEYNGKTYKVINFTELSEDTDLSTYGFEPNTTPKTTRLFVHMSNKAEKLDVIEKLANTTNGSFLCASYVSPKRCPTYYELKFGVSLEAENTNVANYTRTNQFSGQRKNYDDFFTMVNTTPNRSEQANFIMKTLNINAEEYAELFKQIAPKQFLSQIKDNEIYNIKQKQLTGANIKKALQKLSQNSLCAMIHNEANLYQPHINAFVAKVDNISKIPKDFLQFVERYDLPIFLLGDKENGNYW